MFACSVVFGVLRPRLAIPFPLPLVKVSSLAQVRELKAGVSDPKVAGYRNSCRLIAAFLVYVLAYR